jgi:hypothetical protein
MKEMSSVLARMARSIESGPVVRTGPSALSPQKSLC